MQPEPIAALLVVAGILLGSSPPAAGPSEVHPQPAAVMSENRYQYGAASTTSSADWSALPIRKGPCKGDIDNCRYPEIRVGGDGRLTVVWRGLVTGAPVELRLLDDAAETMPSSDDVVVEPGRGRVTFVSTSDRVDACSTGLQLLWRSPTGKPATVAMTTTVVSYQRNPAPAAHARGCA